MNIIVKQKAKVSVTKGIRVVGGEGQNCDRNDFCWKKEGKKERNDIRCKQSHFRSCETYPTSEASVPMQLWSRTTKNPDVSTGPLTRLLARSLAWVTYLLAPHCFFSLARSAALIPSLAQSLLSLWKSEVLDSYFGCVLFCSGPQCVQT